MIVEFVGLPGAGKTTLLNAVANGWESPPALSVRVGNGRDDRDGAIISSRQRRLRTVTAAVRNPMVAARLLVAQPVARVRDPGLNLLRRCELQRQWRRASDNVLVDEGVVQGVLGASARHGPFWEGILPARWLPDRMVVVEADADEALRNIRRRGQEAGVDLLDDDALAGLLARMAAALPTVLDRCDRPALHVRPSADAPTEVLAFLAQALTPAESP